MPYRRGHSVRGHYRRGGYVQPHWRGGGTYSLEADGCGTGCVGVFGLMVLMFFAVMPWVVLLNFLGVLPWVGRTSMALVGIGAIVFGFVQMARRRRRALAERALRAAATPHP